MVSVCFRIFRPQVVECLSKLVRDDALVGKSPQVSKECRAQLTVEKLQAVSVVP